MKSNKIVRETLNFKRGQDPNKSLGLGIFSSPLSLEKMMDWPDGKYTIKTKSGNIYEYCDIEKNNNDFFWLTDWHLIGELKHKGGRPLPIGTDFGKNIKYELVDKII